jgi:asparagine synthetase B (glutamine-hydrolysing)
MELTRENILGILGNITEPDLKKDLVNNHKFKSHTDSEVLIHGYEEWGFEKLVKKLNGMFAFCR